MAKRNQKKREQQQSDNIKAGHYTPSMIGFLGYETIKNVYDATMVAAEEARKFSAEVRNKGLQTAALLDALVIGLVTAFGTIESPFARFVMVAMIVVLTNALRGIMRNVIYRKENIHSGNTQSRMLSEQMINALHKVDKNNRSAFVLASTLKKLEESVELQNKQTEEKQLAYQREIDTLVTLLVLLVIFAVAFIALCHSFLPVY